MHSFWNAESAMPLLVHEKQQTSVPFESKRVVGRLRPSFGFSGCFDLVSQSAIKYPKVLVGREMCHDGLAKFGIHADDIGGPDWHDRISVSIGLPGAESGEAISIFVYHSRPVNDRELIGIL